jgi:transcription elongation factor Elf1
MWRNGVYTAFKCPLCGSGKYVQVRVQKANGNWYTTEFYKCFHCTVMFHDPVLFTWQESSSVTDKYSADGAYRGTPPRAETRR